MESTQTDPGTRAAFESVARLWWLWIVFGIAWMAISVVVLQFDQASVNTVGVLIGIMFLGSSLQQMVIASMAERGRLVYWLFGALFLVAAVLAFVSPENTFAAIADILGFLFLLVGIFWILQAFVSREINDLWWLGLLSGSLMVILAFWTGGQFFIEREYVLLVFAGIWALLHGITDLVRAFQIRKLGRLV